MVFDRTRRAYYRAPLDAVPSAVLHAARPQRTTVPTWAVWCLVGLLIALLVANALLLPPIDRQPHTAEVITAAVYLAVSIGLHEGSHVLALHSFGRAIDRIGFTLNHRVFPAFYVRMNQSLLLGRQEQVCVHAAGLLVNLAVNAVVLAFSRWVEHSPALDLAAGVVFIAAAWNVVPVLNSDGYRILLSLTGTDAARELRANPPWLVTLKVVSVVLVVVVSAHTVFTLMRSSLA